MHSLKVLSFFPNSTSAPQGDQMGLMKPLSNKSYGCSFSSLSFAGAIL